MTGSSPRRPLSMPAQAEPAPCDQAAEPADGLRQPRRSLLLCPSDQPTTPFPVSMEQRPMHPYGYPPPPPPPLLQQQQQQQSHPHRPQPLLQTAWSTAAPGATSSTQPPLSSFPPREPAPVPTAAVKGKAPKRANPAPVVAASEGGSEPEKKKRKRTGFACRASLPSPCCALGRSGPDPTDGLPLLLSPGFENDASVACRKRRTKVRARPAVSFP
jgi:hypothetical protein